MGEPNGQKLGNLYKLAWVRGLKTTCYLRSMGLRSMGATHIEKSTMADASKANRLSAVGGSYISISSHRGGTAINWPDGNGWA